MANPHPVVKMPSGSERPDDTVIWRYMSFVKFVSMLQEHALFFARPCKFNDQWEGLCPPSHVRNDRLFAKMCDMPPQKCEAEIKRRLQRHRFGHFVSCWNIGAHESDAMWRLYGLAPEGVAIQSTVGSVKKCLRPDDSGAVNYYDPGHDLKLESIFGLSDILFKRKTFAWENEYRFWFDDDEILERIGRGEAIDEAALPHGKSVQISDMQELIKRIAVAPGARDDFIRLVKDVCGTYHKIWLGNLVERSYSDRSWESFCD
jgi:hypothetical protein